MKINKLYRLFTLACLMLFCLSNVATAQTKGKKVSATVVDEQGNPLSDVKVFGSKGVRASTDITGKFLIAIDNDESLVIQKKGYESELINEVDFTKNITLVKSPFLATEDDEIKMGVTTKDRRDMVGAVSTINTRDRLTYDNTQWVRNYISGLTLGVRGSDNVRGLGSAVFVIDGVIGRDPNILNMEEVEQITVLKDANAVALYGSQGRNGVIVINTKRGKINKKEINVNVRTGISVPIALPNYLSSAAYMQLFNEARNNDGLDNFYDPALIQNFRSGSNKYKYPDVDLYSSEYVQPFINTTSIISEFSGGNDKNQYYVNVGWNRNEDWVNINDDINAGTNRFNLRGNIDFKINDWITSSLDGIAVISSNKGSRANLLSAGTTLKPNAYSPFLPANLVDTSDETVAGQLQAASLFNGMLLGTSQELQLDAPIALAIAGGYRNTVFRSTQFNNSLNFDLSKITKGLSAKTYLSFDFYDSYNLSINNQFKTYAPEWNGDRIANFGRVDHDNDPLTPDITDDSRIYGEDLKDLTENVSTNGFVSRFGFYGLVNYQKNIDKNNSINTTFLGYYNSEKSNNVIQTNIDSHLGLQMTYDFKKKVFVDFTAAYTHSIKLPEGNRNGLAPTFGLAYILSEEPFLKDSKFINYLKLKATGGIIKSDQGITALNDNGTVDNGASNYYLYDENYSRGGNFVWADGSSNSRQVLSQGANPNLGFEERIDFNIGFETYLMNSLWIEANYFRTELDKQLTFLQDQYPSFYNAFRPYDNFNNNLYTGFELGINFNKTINDFKVGIGANILYSQTEALKRSETNEFDYQNRVGKELSTIFGLVDGGFYSEADFDASGNLNAGLPVPQFGEVQPGDIKYLDQNGDDIIDNDDNVAIGQASSPFTYGVNLNLKYKAFNLFILGTGQTGGEANKLSSSFNNYYEANGNNKYSEVAIGRWTPATASTATYPRLSSQSNQNNFKTSTFWLYNNNFFEISRAQLTYEFTDDLCNKLGLDDFSLNIQGTNLFEVSKNRDIRQLTIGGTPQARAYTLGLRMSF
ncbi:SusC/RagA family TonB-linked outer membrane protein [Tamlana crocina]|uniref:SusC/RagA family TonB-linked outer membrane protein n=1 Tax=Tamlana crocina TaxID=393006 RepID=A0ABX1DAV5_9FLAO|nr:SusC/RagA family TonB-linked outer membrane protein [Tamlana crocina]NJX14332.1 SusC/RagA family TonB-linked outer membrane protein [Tamlana crocina]